MHAGPNSVRLTLIAAAFTLTVSAASAQDLSCSGCTATPVDPYGLPVLAPPPELTGDYALPYLYSPQTGYAYSDPMYYYGLRQLAKWDAMKPLGSSRTRSVTRSRTSHVTAASPAPARASSSHPARKTRTPMLPDEVSDK